ncbi:copper radical oxidase [Tilletiaria anomala UBC 951]|uniref:Copper radical oxidase n=1 Tax=Tilletiaria anomala (strain ATCC 24038 / CBS 436.72 / UBC 951) TaxID=1037660 RepID=A0A066WIK3_TILAU|nr:copper radical oxidase [Tilletiaria anomala UBC 951]KDN52348.1 copper radical oxidase [Tilletiaria anomala UBC 951]
MKLFSSALVVLALVAFRSVMAGSPLSFEVINDNSIVSAMMLGLINENTVMILDKVEDNAYHFSDGKPAWASLLNLANNKVKPIEANSNTFCAGGGVLANGTWVVFGGNTNIKSDGSPQTTGIGPYNAQDGGKAVRFVEPTSDYNSVTWLDDGSHTMAATRWYPGVEILATGEALLIGGMTGGGYINRNTNASWPNNGGTFTYEYFPPRAGGERSTVNFLRETVGLNTYAHTFLMPSGKVFMQANVSTTLWDHEKNTEQALDDMPGNVVRVYPASAATAMLPLTPENSYTPTILFCGGSVLTEQQWGNYTGPGINVQTVEASSDCSSITPENFDGSQRDQHYTQEDSLPEGRSMGQFIHLPDQTMLIINGANKGTAGYVQKGADYIVNGIDTEGLAQDPTYTPVLYDPSKPQGSRFTRNGFGKSPIARLYHSTALLLPDGSVLVAGSNPHMNVATNMPRGTTPQGYNTTYELEKWYPSYYFKVRPLISSTLPNSIPFGGSSFNITIDKSSMGKSANALAARTKVVVIRPGFTTHAMNMGQRSLQLDNSYVVNDDGSVTLIVNPFPTNPNIFVAGPALLFVVVNGVPSMGKMISVGTNATGTGLLPWTPVVGAQLRTLPNPVTNAAFNAAISTNSSSLSLGAIIGIAVAGAAALLLIALIFICVRRRRARTNKGQFAPVAMNDGSASSKSHGQWSSSPSASSPLFPSQQQYRDSSSIGSMYKSPPNSYYAASPMFMGNSTAGNESIRSYGQSPLYDGAEGGGGGGGNEHYRDSSFGHGFSAPPLKESSSLRGSWIPDDRSDGGWAAARYYQNSPSMQSYEPPYQSPRRSNFSGVSSQPYGAVPGSPAPRHATFLSPVSPTAMRTAIPAQQHGQHDAHSSSTGSQTFEQAAQSQSSYAL